MLMCTHLRLVIVILLDGPNEVLLFLLAGFCSWRSCRWVRDLVMGCKLQKFCSLAHGLSIPLPGQEAERDFTGSTTEDSALQHSDFAVLRTTVVLQR